MNLQRRKPVEKGRLEPYGGTRENTIASVLRIAAWVLAILLVLSGLTLGAVGILTGLFSGAMTGLLLYVAAEVISLLQLKQTQSYRLVVYETVEEQPVSEEPPAQESQEVSQSTKEARFPERNGDVTIQCPFCGSRQRGDRKVCFQCGARFVYDDDPT